MSISEAAGGRDPVAERSSMCDRPTACLLQAVLHFGCESSTCLKVFLRLEKASIPPPAWPEGPYGAPPPPASPPQGAWLGGILQDWVVHCTDIAVAMTMNMEVRIVIHDHQGSHPPTAQAGHMCLLSWAALFPCTPQFPGPSSLDHCRAGR